MSTEMKEVETFIGPCSKYITGQGWTTEVPVEQIKAKGYRKESDTAKEIWNDITSYYFSLRVIGNATVELDKLAEFWRKRGVEVE